jgi:signal transduction histidine kinase
MFFKGHELSGGSGLGLYVVKKATQALQGSIGVESDGGRYAKIIVSLPLVIKSTSVRPAPPIPVPTAAMMAS